MLRPRGPRIRPWPLLVGLLALVGRVAPSAAQATTGLAIARRGPEELEAAPGAVVTTTFRISNPSALSASLRPEVTAPSGWRVLAGPGELAVPPGAAAVWLVSVAVPGAALAGPHPLRLRVRGEGADVVFADSLRVRVAEQPRLQVQVVDAPSYAAAGEGFRVDLAVGNQGNATADVRVRVVSRGAVRVVGGDTSLILRPGQARSIPVRLAARPDVSSSAPGVVEVIVESAARSEVTARRVLEVVVVPRPSGRAALLHRLPSRLTVRAADGWYAPLSGEVVGSGRLRDGDPSTVDFTLRSRSGSGQLALQQEQYSLGLASERLDLRFGHHHLRLSSLAGGGRYGFGIGGTYSGGRVALGGGVQRHGNAASGLEQGSGFLSYRLPGGTALGAQLVRLQGADSGTLGSLRWSHSSDQRLRLELEYGLGWGGTGAGRGAAADLSGERGAVTYQLSYRAGDTGLPGPFRGTRNGFASLGVDLLPNARVGVHANRYARGPPSWDAAGAATDDRSVALTATWGPLVAAEYRWRGLESQSPSGASTEDERAVRLHVTPRLGDLSLATIAESGNWREPRTGLGGRFHQYTLMPVWSSPWHTASGYLRYEHGRRIASADTLGGRWSVGLSLGARLADRLRLQLSADDQRGGGGYPRQTRMDARLQRELRDGHRVTLRAQRVRRASAALGPSSVVLEYSLPLGVPVGRARAPGLAVGRVTDGERGAGVAGAVVRLGDALSVSDRSGFVVFRGVPAGEHRLSLARSPRPALVAVGDTLVSVSAAPGPPSRFHLAVLPGGHVRGSVRRVTQESIASGATRAEAAADTVGMENIVVALASAGDTIHLVTDPYGNFDAGDVRPGRWQLWYVSGELPHLHEVAEPRVDFSVEAGQSVEVGLLVRPRRREIKLIGGGEVVGPSKRQDRQRP